MRDLYLLNEVFFCKAWSVNLQDRRIPGTGLGPTVLQDTAEYSALCNWSGSTTLVSSMVTEAIDPVERRGGGGVTPEKQTGCLTPVTTSAHPRPFSPVSFIVGGFFGPVGFSVSPESASFQRVLKKQTLFIQPSNQWMRRTEECLRMFDLRNGPFSLFEPRKSRHPLGSRRHFHPVKTVRFSSLQKGLGP